MPERIRGREKGAAPSTASVRALFINASRSAAELIPLASRAMAAFGGSDTSAWPTPTRITASASAEELADLGAGFNPAWVIASAIRVTVAFGSDLLVLGATAPSSFANVSKPSSRSLSKKFLIWGRKGRKCTPFYGGTHRVCEFVTAWKGLSERMPVR